MNQIQISELSKLYYSIGEVADMFEVSPSLIRYWESEFSILKPNKNAKGDRRYTKQNIEHLQLVFHLVKEKGFTLEGAKKELKENKGKLNQIQKIEATLKHLKNRMIQFKNGLAE
jgi:DNA-binding transcriptional MerR regulator